MDGWMEGGRDGGMEAHMYVGLCACMHHSTDIYIYTYVCMYVCIRICTDAYTLLHIYGTSPPMCIATRQPRNQV